MPLEIMNECIGKVCAILAYGESFGTTGKVVAIEGNWMKVQVKKQVKLINTDMIINITILPEKYQK